MKKFLLLLVVGFALLQTGKTQPYLIDVAGGSALGDPAPEVTIDPYMDVVKVVAEAIYFYPDGSVAPGNVNFYNDGNAYEASFSLVDPHHGGGQTDNPNQKGYYRTTIQPVGDETVILDKTVVGSDPPENLGDKIDAFYTYVYREGTSCKYSLTDPEQEPAWLYKKGEDYTADAMFQLEPATGLRDITITIPIIDNENRVTDDREGVVTISGTNLPPQADVVFALNSFGTNFDWLVIPLNNVENDVTDITVKIYSPVDNGDSFIAGTVVLTVEEECETGCTHTQGYWKTHSKHGPAPYDPTWAKLDDDNEDDSDMMFYNSGKSWYEVFWTPVRGNIYYQLAHQYMAARLSELSGASVPAEVQTAMDDAEYLFNNPENLSKEHIYLAELLDDYNNGIIGPGHCDDEEIEVEREHDEQENRTQAQNEGKGKGKSKNKSAQIERNVFQIDGLSVYPNPVVNSATISFMPVSDGNATIDLYNSAGQRVSRLFEQNVSQDVPVNIQFNSSEYKEGLYILRVQNESGLAATRVQIAR